MESMCSGIPRNDEAKASAFQEVSDQVICKKGVKFVYLPIKMASDLDVNKIGSPAWRECMCRAASDPDGVMNFLWYDPDLLHPKYQGKYKYLNELLIKDRTSLYKVCTGNGTIPREKSQDCALARETITMFEIIGKWAQCKQVYSFDPEMELAFADAEDVELPVRVLDSLPYRCIYVEFAKEGIFSSHFEGAFVNIVPYELGYFLYICRVRSDGSCMFGSCALVPDERDGVFLFSRDNITAEDGVDRNRDWQEFCFFLLNALLYLCAANSEINESEVTKKTYRPSTVVKNKFSEIRRWECGYRYGAEVRLHRQKESVPETSDLRNDEAKASAFQEVSYDPGKHSTRKTLARRTVHMRRAHWHHYWVGPKSGDRHLILKWIPPVVVGGGDLKEAVVHKVREP